MSDIPTYYDILGVDRSASADDIKSAYRAAARKYHPDRLQDGSGDSHLFNLVQKAYETLSNPESRAEYDEALDEAFGGVGRRRPPSNGPSAGGGYRPGPSSGAASGSGAGSRYNNFSDVPLEDTAPPPFRSGANAHYMETEEYWSSYRARPRVYQLGYWLPNNASKRLRLENVAISLVSAIVLILAWSIYPKAILGWIPFVVPTPAVPAAYVLPLAAVWFLVMLRVTSHLHLSELKMSSWLRPAVMVFPIGLGLVLSWVEIGLVIFAATIVLSLLVTIGRGFIEGASQGQRHFIR